MNVCRCSGIFCNDGALLVCLESTIEGIKNQVVKPGRKTFKEIITC